MKVEIDDEFVEWYKLMCYKIGFDVPKTEESWRELIEFLLRKWVE